MEFEPKIVLKHKTILNLQKTESDMFIILYKGTPRTKEDKEILKEMDKGLVGKIQEVWIYVRG